MTPIGHGAAAAVPPGGGTAGVATELAEARRRLLGRTPDQLAAAGLRAAWRELHESWLAEKAAEAGITAGSGFAVVATGSLGRGELLPFSDLDLMLLHDDKPAEIVGQVAESLWYPLWDNNIRLDHSVRTVAEALSVAGAEISTALAILDARHIVGDEWLSAQLIDGARQYWRREIRSRFGDLLDVTYARWRRSGEIAHRVEPDLKYGRGGLRDIQVLDALALAQLADRLSTPRADDSNAYRTLLDVRTELHRVSGRGHDTLLAQYADEIGAALRIGDRYELARTLSDAARTISYRVDTGLRTAANALPRRGIATVRPRMRRPLDEGVVTCAGEVMLARDVRPQRDGGLVLRVAAAAAATGLPIADATLTRLAETAPDLPTPWPAEALGNLLVVLSAGQAAVATIEALDRSGLWGRLFPEWKRVRDLPSRDAIHVWTVDRHLVETTCRAAAFTTRVARPDLLVLAALLHDIGKGSGADHSTVGAELATAVGTRLGMWPSDIEMLASLVRHHLLLSKAATRHDLSDPETIDTVAATLGGDPVLLDVLHALTEADALATGPGVWSDWKASLVDDLVRRCRLVMAGEPLPYADPVDPEFLTLAADHRVEVQLRPGPDPRRHRVVMIAPDQRGMLSKAAGVLTLNSLRVQSAVVNIHGGSVIDEFVVSPLFGVPPAPAALRQQLLAALRGDIDVLGELARRDSSTRPGPAGAMPAGVPGHRTTAPPRIRWFEGAPGRLILEIRATDRTGLLARLTGALERAGADIDWAKVTTLGSMADDVFCVAVPARAHPTLGSWQSEVAAQVLAAVRIGDSAD